MDHDHTIRITGPATDRTFAATANEALGVIKACDEVADEQATSSSRRPPSPIARVRADVVLRAAGIVEDPERGRQLEDSPIFVSPEKEIEVLHNRLNERCAGVSGLRHDVACLEAGIADLRATIEAMNEDVRRYAAELADARRQRQRDEALAERDKNIAMKVNAVDQRAELHAEVVNLRDAAVRQREALEARAQLWRDAALAMKRAVVSIDLPVDDSLTSQRQRNP